MGGERGLPGGFEPCRTIEGQKGTQTCDLFCQTEGTIRVKKVLARCEPRQVKARICCALYMRYVLSVMVSRCLNRLCFVLRYTTSGAYRKLRIIKYLYAISL